MPRKFRLSVHHKNEFRKQRERTVTVQHEYTTQFSQWAVQHTSIHPVFGPVSQPDIPSPRDQPALTVSIPREIMLDCKVPSLMKLQERLKVWSVLPHGMVP